MTIPIATFGFGLMLFLVSLPMIILSFIIPAFWLFSTGLIVGATGTFFFLFGMFLKGASILFRK